MTSLNTRRHELRPPAASDENATVFVVDDDESVRRSLELLIASAGWQPKTFSTAQAFLSCPRVHAPSCLVLDVTLPDISGLELQKRVAAERIDMPIIFISGYGNVPTTVQAMKAGAIEFLTKPLRSESLFCAIRQAIAGSREILVEETEMRTLRERHASLSTRERQVMSRVVTGLLNKQVAHELGISEITVKTHRGSVMRKMQVDSLPDLVRLAARLGVVASRNSEAGSERAFLAGRECGEPGPFAALVMAGERLKPA